MRKFIFKNLKENIPYLAFLSLLLLFLFLNLFYNNRSEALAQKQIQCDPQIPIGEAVDKSGELLSALTQELLNVDKGISEQIKAAEEMINQANQCGIQNCRPVNCGSEAVRECVDNDPVTGACTKWKTKIICKSRPDCTSPWEKKACPQGDINTSFSKVEQSFNSIRTSADNIKKLLADKTENICDQANEDIRLPNEKCVGITKIEVTKIEVVQRKLNKSRALFDACTIAPADWQKVEEGKLSPKRPLRCDDVLGAGLQRKQPDCRCSPQVSPLPQECGGVNKKSLLNYYCCR